MALAQHTVLLEQLILAVAAVQVELQVLQITLFTTEVLVAQELLLLDIHELK